MSRLWLEGIEVVETKVSIHPLNMVLADRSVVAAYFEEEKALVVVRETSPDEKNSLRQLEFGAESDEEWNSSCLAQFSDCLGMPTMRFEKVILVLLNKWIMRKDQKNRRSGAKRVKIESSRSERELKRLECSINFKSAGNGIALF